MKDKRITPEAFKARLTSGMSIMFGGFMGVGTPCGLVAAILQSGVSRLTIIGNDTAFPTTGVGPLIRSGQVERVVASHIGTNPETGKLMMNGRIEVQLIPQGTLAERIRAGGAGLGGVLTPTGAGTSVAEGKQELTLDGKRYLLERALRADLAILKAFQADAAGNLVYRRAARNFNPLMALACTDVVAEVDELVDVGALDPERIATPAALVDALLVA